MSSIKKITKKVLQGANIINESKPPPTPTPTPQPEPESAGSLPSAPEPVNYRDLIASLQPAVAPPTPRMLAMERKGKLARLAAGDTGRAATVLSRRSTRRRRSSETSLEGGGADGGSSYTNDLLGK
jgi:hypothetical protein